VNRAPALAVQFLETHPGEIEARQRPMGHSKIETTQIYVRHRHRGRSWSACAT
jgi:site-specific recombinase XerC